MTNLEKQSRLQGQQVASTDLAVFALETVLAFAQGALLAGTTIVAIVVAYRCRAAWA